MTLPFSVKPASVLAMASDIQGLADLTGYGSVCEYVSGQQFVDQYVVLGYVPQASLYSEIQSKTDDLRKGLLGILKQLGGVLSASASELRRTAETYSTIDAAAQARLDAAYPEAPHAGTPTVPTLQDPIPPLFAFQDAPKLGTTDMVTQVLTHEWTSPSATVALVISLIFHVNPIDEISKRFVGDWTYVDRCGEALDELANFHKFLGHAAGQEVSNRMADWTGEAADAALAYFWKQSTAGQKLAGELTKTAETYAAIAKGMEAACAILTGLFAKIMDRILYVIALQVLAVATIETVVGTVIFEILDIVNELSIPELVIQVAEEFNKIDTMVDGFKTLLGAAILGFGDAGVSFTFPSAYNNPQV